MEFSFFPSISTQIELGDIDSIKDLYSIENLSGYYDFKIKLIRFTS